MKTQYLFLMLLMINCVVAIDYNYTINKTSLPFNNIINDTLISSINSTANVTYGQFVSGDSKVVFDVATKTIFFNINIPEYILSGNYSSLVLVEAPNFTNKYNLYFNIINNTINYDVNYSIIDINEFEYDVCDYSLPWNKTHSIFIIYQPDATIQTLFDDDFFVFEDEFIMPPDGEKTLDIFLTLDENVSIGKHTKIIQFNLVSNFANITFHFNVKDCIAPFPACEKMIEDCSIQNMSYDEYIICEGLKAECQRERYEALLEANRTRYINDSYPVYFNNTRLISALPLNDSRIVDAIIKLPTTVNEMLVDNRRKDKTIIDLESENKQLKDQNYNIKTQTEKEMMVRYDDIIDENKQLRINLTKMEKATVSKGSMWSLFILVLFLSGIIYLIYLYKINNFW